MNAVSEGLRWLAPSEPSVTARVLALALAGAVLVVGILVHRSTTFPGPLSVAERRAARTSKVRRLGALMVYRTTAIIWVVSLIFLALSPRRPVLLMLASRAQVEPLLEAETLCAADGPERPAGAFRDLAGGAPALDLGLLVDAIVSRCGAACENFGSTAQEQRSLAELVRTTVLDTRLSPVGDPSGISSGLDENGVPRFPRVQRTVLETIEVSVLQLALARFNAREVRILPGNSYESRANWDISRTFLSRAETPVRLCGQAGLGLPPEPVVTRFAEAQWTAAGQISGWALIEGRFADHAAEHRISLTVEPWGATVPGADPMPTAKLTLRVAADALTSRIVRLCFGNGCGDAPAPAPVLAEQLSVVRKTAVTRGAAVRLHADGSVSGLDVWAPVRLLLVGDNPPDLIVDGGVPARWRQLFEDVAMAPRHAAFRAELAGMGLQVPRLVSSSSDARAPVLVASSHWLAISVDATAARRSAAVAGAGAPAPRSRPGRVRPSSALGPATVFSLTDLPVTPALGTEQRPLGQVATVESATPGEGERVGTVEQAALLREGQHEAGKPFFVLGMEQVTEALSPLSSRYEPVTALALVRAIAWCAQTVRDGASGGAGRMSAQHDPISHFTTPLMTPADAHDVAREGTKRADATLLSALGLSLLVTVFTTLRRQARKE